MPRTRWPRVEAAALRHLAERSPASATAAAVAEATGLPADDVTYALEALHKRGAVDTFLDGDVRRWRAPDASGDG